MRTLAIDIETFSSVDLTKCGVYPYSQSEDFEVLLLAYAFDDEEVQVVDLASGEAIPEEVIAALTDPKVITTAFNAQFERTCLKAYLGMDMPPEQWRCSQAHALTMGLPGHLSAVAKVMGLKEQKMKEGKALIRYFSMPCRATKTNGARTRNLPYHDTEKWELFKSYCIKDVQVEREIRRKLAPFPMIDKEQKLWELDQRINDRGIKLDKVLVEHAIKCDEQYQKKLTKEATDLTGLDNPNSPAQLKAWLKDVHGVEVESLAKDAVAELLEETEAREVKHLLELRQEMSKTSVKKYEAMMRAIRQDERAGGLLQYYGANRTGRWASRLIQIQNLPRNSMTDLNLARELLRAGDYETLELLFDSVPDTLSQLIRTAFIPSEGHRLIISDFSAIEAKVIAYLAGESWVIKTFKGHGKIYEMTASRMFGVPLEKIVKGNPEYELRAKGKIATLACIAEGQKVLTDEGLVPIESVTLNHKVWDGENFVRHDGVIYRGEKEVIAYGGLTATKDHLVWIEGKSEPVQFGEAAASRAHLLLTGNGRQAIRMGENYKPGKKVGQELESLLDVNAVRKLQRNTMDKSKQLTEREIKRMPEMLPTEADSPLARQETHSCKAEMRKSKRSGIQKLWCQRDSVQVRFCNRSGAVDYRKLRTAQQKLRNRQNRQQRSLREGKFKICNKKAELWKQKNNSASRMEARYVAVCKNGCSKKDITGHDKRRSYKGCEKSCKRETKKLEDHRSEVRVYDILNAGPNHRFTVSGVLVHNCGFQGSVGALKAMGAEKMGLSEVELKHIVDAWRRANPNIVKFWYVIEDAAIRAVKGRTHVTMQHGLKLYYKSGMLFIQLPSGRKLVYVKPRIEIDDRFNKEKLTYEGMEQTTRTWGRISTYGGRLVENCLSGDTLVLTHRGWKKIVDVSKRDLVWDGYEWVKHSGLAYRGMKQTIDINGVRMTEDHLVLTEEGWKDASSCQGYKRAKVKLPNSDSLCRFRWNEVTLESQMRLWKRVCHACNRVLKSCGCMTKELISIARTTHGRPTTKGTVLPAQWGNKN